MTTFFLTTTVPAAISGISTFFIFMMVLAVVAGIGVVILVPWPIRGLGIGLIVGALVITLIVATGPSK